MPKVTQEDPGKILNDRLHKLVPRFTFEFPQAVVGLSHFADDLQDEEIYDGLIYSAHGYARIARHMPTGTICLITSKESRHLQGKRNEDGKIIATKESLSASYIVAARRTDGTDADVYIAAPHMRHALNRFWENIAERSEKHFTKYSISLDPQVFEGGTDDDHGCREVHTNGVMY